MKRPLPLWILLLWLIFLAFALLAYPNWHWAEALSRWSGHHNGLALLDSPLWPSVRNGYRIDNR